MGVLAACFLVFFLFFVSLLIACDIEIMAICHYGSPQVTVKLWLSQPPSFPSEPVM